MGRRGGQERTDSKTLLQQGEDEEDKTRTDSNTLLQQGEDEEDKHGPTLRHCYNRGKMRRTRDGGQGRDEEDKHGPTLRHCYNRGKMRRTSTDRL